MEKCARCGGQFNGGEGFLTCESCRRPLRLQSFSGCRRWEGVGIGPKLTEFRSNVGYMTIAELKSRRQNGSKETLS